MLCLRLENGSLVSLIPFKPLTNEEQERVQPGTPVFCTHERIEHSGGTIHHVPESEGYLPLNERMVIAGLGTPQLR